MIDTLYSETSQSGPAAIRPRHDKQLGSFAHAHHRYRSFRFACPSGRPGNRQVDGAVRVANAHADLRRQLEGDDRGSEEGHDVQRLFEDLPGGRIDGGSSGGGRAGSDHGACTHDGGKTGEGGESSASGKRSGNGPHWRSTGRRDGSVQGRHLHDVEDAFRFVLASRWRREVALTARGFIRALN